MLEYERALDFATGVLARELVWRTPAGKRVLRHARAGWCRFTERHLAVITSR